MNSEGNFMSDTWHLKIARTKTTTWYWTLYSFPSRNIASSALFWRLSYSLHNNKRWIVKSRPCLMIQVLNLRLILLLIDELWSLLRTMTLVWTCVGLNLRDKTCLGRLPFPLFIDLKFISRKWMWYLLVILHLYKNFLSTTIYFCLTYNHSTFTFLGSQPTLPNLVQYSMGYSFGILLATVFMYVQLLFRTASGSKLALLEESPVF